MTNQERSWVPQASRIPEFKSCEEEAEFRDTHDFTDSADEFRTVQARFAAKLSIAGITVPLEREMSDRLRAAADVQGITPRRLAQRWLVERLGQDASPVATAAERSELIASGTTPER